VDFGPSIWSHHRSVLAVFSFPRYSPLPRYYRLLNKGPPLRLSPDIVSPNAFCGSLLSVARMSVSIGRPFMDIKLDHTGTSVSSFQSSLHETV